MSVNSSSSNAFLSLSSPSSSLNVFSFLHNCLNSTDTIFSITAFTVTSVLILLPLCILVLYLGHQQWRSCMAMSHSDIFTYHMVVIELMSILGSILSCFGVYNDLTTMKMLGIYLFIMNLCGQMFFHSLTCVERYLAVVHPVTYLSLRKVKGIRIRNISTGCVLVASFVVTGFMYMANHVSMVTISICIITFVLISTFFCSVSVLCVLIRPGPGEGCEGRQRPNQSKLRSFYTITVIQGTLLLRFGVNILSLALYASQQLGENEKCYVWVSGAWFGLPSSLVLPLLFLQRAGKLLCCKNNN